MRFWVLLAVLFVAGAARADDAGAEWADFSQNASALDDVTPADCETACKALQSLARAAEHICAVAPEHCQEARARVAAAREKVRAACPDCAVQFQDDRAKGEVTVANESLRSAPARGGCAGCTTSGGGARGALFALAMLLLLARIRRR